MPNTKQTQKQKPKTKLHKAKTLETAALEGYRVAKLTDALWRVYNPEGYVYDVWPKEGECGCPSVRTCRHLRFVWTMEKLMDLNTIGVMSNTEEPTCSTL